MPNHCGAGCRCKICIEWNLKRHGHNDPDAHTATEPGKLVHIDGMEGFKCASIWQGYNGAYIFVDDYSTTKMVIGYIRKSDVLKCIQEYVRIRKHKNVNIKSLQFNIKCDCVRL